MFLSLLPCFILWWHILHLFISRIPLLIIVISVIFIPLCFNHHSCFTSNWFTTFIIHLPFFQRKFYFHIFSYALSTISFQIKEGFFNFSCRDIFLVMNSNFCLPGKLWSLLQFWMITYQIEDPWLEDFLFSNLSHHSLRPGKLAVKTCW